MALQHLGDVPVSLKQMLNDFIEIKLERLKEQMDATWKLAKMNLTCVDGAMVGLSRTLCLLKIWFCCIVITINPNDFFAEDI